MRAALSSFAIAIGAAAFMYTFAMVSGMNARFAKALELSGPGRIEIFASRSALSSSAPGVKNGKIRPFTYEDAQVIHRQIPTLYQASPMLRMWDRISYKKLDERININAISPQWRKRGWAFTLRGRFLNDYDVNTAARVAVIVESGDWPLGKSRPWWLTFWSTQEKGYKAYVKHHDMLGERIRLGGHIFTVVGVLKLPPRGEDPRWFMITSEADAYVPITTGLKLFSRDGETITDFVVDTGRADNVAEVKSKMESIIRQRHGGNMSNIQVRDFHEMMTEILARVNKDLRMIMLIGFIAVFSGGIGIMNVMLATVFSRIREIGTRRALGASRGDIMVQFVIESTLLGLLGGLAGVGLGYVMLNYMKGDQLSLEHMQWWVPLASLTIAALAGFLSALYPAWSAARMDPIEALRYE